MKIYLKSSKSFIKELIFKFFNQFKKLINQKIIFPNRVFYITYCSLSFLILINHSFRILNSNASKFE